MAANPIPPPEAEPDPALDPYDDIVAQSFPASDPPPSPIHIGEVERNTPEAEEHQPA
jgi:hypothetical protein